MIWTIGERVQRRLENAGLPVERVFPTPSSVEAIASLITDIFLKIESSGELAKTGKIFQIHNHPIVRGSYEHHCRQLLPLDEQWREEITKLAWPTKLLPEMIGSVPDDLISLIREHLFTSVFQACTESCVAEHAARLAAMQLAEKKSRIVGSNSRWTTTINANPPSAETSLISSLDSKLSPSTNPTLVHPILEAKTRGLLPG